MKNALLFLVLMIGFLSSCSKAPGKSEAKFKIGISAITDITAVGNAGAMLWGRSSTGDMFGRAITPATPIDLTLANGEWTFWAVAWEGDGSGDKFTGTPRCAKTASSLKGSDLVINLTMNNANCAMGDFTPTSEVSGGITYFPKIAHHECQSLTQHNGRVCGASTAMAKTASRRFVLASFKKTKDGPMVITGPTISSKCYSSGTSFGSERLVLGNGVLPAMTFLESFYSSPACAVNDPKGYRSSVFDYGLANTAKLDAVKYATEGYCETSSMTQAQCLELGGAWSGSCTMITSMKSEISSSACVAKGGSYVNNPAMKSFQLVTNIPDTELCSGPRVDINNLSPHPFAAGNGATNSPFSICKEVQLNRIAATNNTASFTLNTNLDMNKTSLFGDQPVPVCSSSDPGTNFTPIGSTYDGGCAEIAASAFSGTFDGNGYTVSNIRARSKVDKNGFIRDGGTIKNLILKNAEFEGENYVGAISGHNATLIENVKVDGGDIRGKDFVGGIAGYYSLNPFFVNNHATDMEVVGKSQYGAVGGLIGRSSYSGALTITKSSFKGLLHSYNNEENIGGLIGYRAGSGDINIDQSMSNGVLLVSGTASSRAGGFVGHALNGTTINNSYSRMSISESGHGMTLGAATLGGLVGTTATLAVNNSYYFGSILHSCFEDSVTDCASSVGTISGGATPSGSNYKGAMLHIGFTTATLTNNDTEVNLKDSTFKTSLVASGFKEVGTGMPVLVWEQHTCTLSANTASVANQVTAGRGNLLINPIILCHEDQWKEIKTYPSLHYKLADNIALSNVSYADVVANFSGTLTGNGHIVSGFYMYVATSQSGGLFQTVSGAIKDVHFAAGVIKTSTGVGLGVSGAIASGGLIQDSQFSSVNLKGQPQVAGVVTATNSGTINRVEVNSIVETTANNMGIVSGVNASGATISRSRIEGRVKINNVGGTVRVGGVVGTNNGTLSEIDTSARIINNDNTETSSFVGVFAGENNGHVNDILLRPYAQLQIGLDGVNYYGHVFGSTTATSSAARIVAANELAVDSSYNTSSRILNFSSYSNHSASNYDNVFSMDGAVFNYSPVARAISSCTFSSPNYTYTSVSPFSKTYSDGFFVQNFNFNSNTGISSRFTGTHTDATSTITSIVGTNMTLPCGPSGLQSGTNFYEIQLIGNHASINHITPAGFANLATFCPAGLDGTGKCIDPDQFDIVTDTVGGSGFNRIISAYGQWLSSGSAPTNYPIWTTSEEGYPKLFIVD